LALEKAAGHFNKTTLDLQAVLNSTNEAAEELEKGWEGASNQVFYRQYQDLKMCLEVAMKLSGMVSKELNGMAERYTVIEKKL
jgi:uncharacterized protein YukE